MTIALAEILLRAALPVMLIYACFSDLFTMRISNRLCLSVAAAFLPTAMLVGLPMEIVLNHFIVGFGVLACAFVLFAMGWIGGGDAKFLAASVLWLGPEQLFEYLALSAALGGLLTGAIIVLRRYPPVVAHGWVMKLQDSRSGVPYGIALGIAAVAMLPHGVVWRAVF
jgi:prepilin peptidase CpaA